MLRRLNKFIRLSTGDKALLLHAFFLVLLIRVALWTLPFRAVRRRVERLANRIQSRDMTCAPSIQKLTGAIEIVSRYVPMASCLTQALAAEVMLSRAGYAPVLRIGVLKRDARFKAHAWVESDGHIVIGDVIDLADFQALPGV